MGGMGLWIMKSLIVGHVYYQGHVTPLPDTPNKGDEIEGAGSLA